VVIVDHATTQRTLASQRLDVLKLDRVHFAGPARRGHVVAQSFVELQNLGWLDTLV
jgi:hypothetical protein